MCYRKIKKQVTNGKSCVTVKLLKQNRQEDEPFVMKTVTQTILYLNMSKNMCYQGGNMMQNKPTFARQ